MPRWFVLEYEIGRCTRRCATTGEEFQPGDVFYSVLLPEGGEIKRLDYSAAVWEQAPDGSLGTWKSVMPDPHAKKVEWAPHDVMLDYFIQLQQQAAHPDTLYVLTLLMVRRHILRLEESERDERGEVMVLYCPRTETEYRVPVVHPQPSRIDTIQAELEQLLFSAVG